MIVMMSPGWWTRMMPIHTNPPVRCIQWSSTSNCVPSIQIISKPRSATISSISFVFRLLTNPQLSLSLQLWQALKGYCINLYLLFLSPWKYFLSLNQPIIVFFTTFDLFPQAPQCTCYTRRILFSLFPNWSVGRVMWTTVYHFSHHIWFSYSSKCTMSDKPNRYQNKIHTLVMFRGVFSHMQG